MGFPCCWPPDSGGAPATPLSVDAGPDSSVDVGDPLTLAGSASGGTPPYVYAWSQVSGPGTATFVDDTDPATDVSFDVAGEYVLRLAAEDSAGQVAADQVTETAEAVPPVFVLDDLVDQPQWAHWVGGSLREAYAGPLFTVRNDVGDDLDIFAGVDGVADVAALSAHCGEGAGRVMSIYNQVASPGVAQVDTDDEDMAALIYNAGSPLTGANGYLKLALPGSRWGNYSGGPFLMVGDVAASICLDIAQESAVANYYAAGANNSGGPAGSNSDWIADGSFEPFDPDPYAEIGTANQTAVMWTPVSGGFPNDSGWVAFARDVGDQLQDTQFLWNGSPVAFTQSTNPTTVPNFNANQICIFPPGGWGSNGVSNSNMMFWNGTKVGASDLATLAAWQATHRV